jgi:hypothetical protein
MSVVRSCCDRSGQRSVGSTVCQHAAVSDWHGGVRRRAPSQPQAAEAWSRGPVDACAICSALFKGAEKRLP